MAISEKPGSLSRGLAVSESLETARPQRGQNLKTMTADPTELDRRLKNFKIQRRK